MNTKSMPNCAMFYHVIIETNEKIGKSQNFATYYKFDIQDIKQIKEEIILPYRQNTEIQFQGYFLTRSQIRRIAIKYSDRQVGVIRSEMLSEHKNMALVYTKENIVEDDKLFQELSINNEIFNDTTGVTTNNTVKENQEPIIFLSHRSIDHQYGDALEKLICGLGVKNNQLIYTTHPLHKIPLNKHIFDYLCECLSKNVYVLFLWSNEYLESPACLNEMGAAWILQKEYTHMFTPDFDFANPKFRECAIDTNKIGAILNGDASCKANIIEFKDKILELFHLSVDEQTWTVLFDNFIGEINVASGKAPHAP